MNNPNIKLNANIISGYDDLILVLRNLGIETLGMICDANLHKDNDWVKQFIEELKSSYDVHIILYEHFFEPSYQYLDKLMEDLKRDRIDTKIDAWIGLGGGSSMDTAKGLAILCKNSGPSIQYKGFPNKLNKPLPVIAIPSTAGSGSEVAFNASFIDEVTKTKMGINFHQNYPIVSILEPSVVASAPRAVVASSGCDALVHCLEAFVSKSTNHVARFFASKSFELILKNLPILLENKGDQSNWSSMQWAAVFAMWGLLNSSSGPVSALSYYLGTHFKIGHGTAGGIFLGKVTRLNHEHGFHDYADLYGWNPDRDLAITREEKSAIVVNEIQALLEKAEIPSTLSECGVLSNDREGFFNFYKASAKAFERNPIEFSQKDLDQILV